MYQRKVICGYKRWVQNISGVKSIRILLENINKINLSLPFVKPFWLDKWGLREG